MRRRRSKGTWLPTLGETTGIDEPFSTVTGIDDSMDLKANGNLTTRIHVITLDAPRETQSDDFTLADVLGSEYLLRRIVGKAFILHVGTDETPIYALVACGFFVARADPENAFYPLGAGTNVITTPDENRSFSPLEQETQREPWLWRRSWVLGNSGVNDVSADPGSTTGTAKLPLLPGEIAPPSSMKYGSVLDGPHLDAKTLRRVGQDDRLYFAISSCRWPVSNTPDPQQEDGIIVYHIDYRLFGSLRKAKQTGRF